MRIIEFGKEKNIKCPKCESIIGFYPHEILEEEEEKQQENDIINIKFIICPACNFKIILEENHNFLI